MPLTFTSIFTSIPSGPPLSAGHSVLAQKQTGGRSSPSRSWQIWRNQSQFIGYGERTATETTWVQDSSIMMVVARVGWGEHPKNVRFYVQNYVRGGMIWPL